MDLEVRRGGGNEIGESVGCGVEVKIRAEDRVGILEIVEGSLDE